MLNHIELDGEKFKQLPIGFLGCNQSDVLLKISHFEDKRLEVIREIGRENRVTLLHMKLAQKLKDLDEYKRNELPNLIVLWAKEFAGILPDDPKFYTSRSNGYYTAPFLKKSSNGRTYLSKIAMKEDQVKYCAARQCVMYVLYTNLKMTKSQISRFIKKDHTTVIHTIKKVQELLDTGNEMITRLIHQLYKRIEKHLA